MSANTLERIDMRTAHLHQLPPSSKPQGHMSHDTSHHDDLPVFSRGNSNQARSDKAELRMMVPRRLLDVFDAVSMARGQERFELVIEELSKSVDRWVHEASLIHNITRSNPTRPDSDGGHQG